MKYYIWTLWPNDHDKWKLVETPYESEESAEAEKLLLQLTGYMVKVLPEGTKP